MLLNQPGFYVLCFVWLRLHVGFFPFSLLGSLPGEHQRDWENSLLLVIHIEETSKRAKEKLEVVTLNVL